MKTRAAVVGKTGGPEVLEYREVDVPDPGPGEALIQHEAVGVNFIDINQRSGAYPLASFPAILGTEAAGVVKAVGPGVADVKVGDRVAYATGPLGAYAQHRVLAAERLVPLPKEIPSTIAASIMVKGLTAEYLLRRTYVVKPGDTIVIHAAAGGVGSLVTQWARHLGATVIGVVGSASKVESAKRFCHHVLLSTEPFAAQIREITKGKGAEVVYDSVGHDTFDASLDSLANRGMVVLFGQSSGKVAPVDVGRLAKGSYYLTRPTLYQYAATRPDLLASAKALFEVIGSGAVKVDPPTQFPLAEAARAHAALESRKTTGALVLGP